MYGLLKGYYILLIYSIFGKYLFSVPDAVSDILVVGFILLSLHNDGYRLNVPRKLGNYCIWVVIVPALIILSTSVITQVFKSLSMDYLVRSTTLCVRWILYCLLGLRTVYVFKEESSDILLVSCLIAYIPSILLYFLQNGIVDGFYTLFSGEAHNKAGALEVHRVTYVFGFLAIYYLYQWLIFRKKFFSRALLSIVLLLLGVKRVASFALVLILIMLLIIKFIKNDKYKYRVTLFLSTLFIVTALVFVYLIKSGNIENTFKTLGIDDKFRFNFWNHISSEYEFSLSFFGNGISYAQRFMWHEWANIKDLASVTNLHNDVLSYYIGLGFLGFIAFFGMFFAGQIILQKKWFTVNSAVLTFLLSAFYFIVMTTSNEGLPGFVYGCFMMLIFAIASSEQTNSNEKRLINE